MIIDPKVAQFIDDLASIDPDKAKIIGILRKMAWTAIPRIKEKMMYGGIVFFRKQLIGGIFVSKEHVSVEFSEGRKLEDPGGLLEGTGKLRRHLKLYQFSDIKNKQVSFYLNQHKHL